MTSTQFVQFVAVGGLVLLAADANSQSIDDARAAFEEGRFLEAADLAEALGTSGGYALAAQSLAVYGHYEATEDDRTGILERAMELGEAAVRADSTNSEAYYQSAHAVGRYAQSVGILTALRRGLAGRVRGLLEATLAICPDFAEAYLGLGGWHADIASTGRVARWMYGADREKAVIHYERARELLSMAAELPASDAYEEFIQEEVMEALAELDGGG